jgi:hypothetical protein
VGAVEFDEHEFFRAIAGSGARSLLIGRRALVALGLPVLTSDYDFWIHIDDIAAFTAALERLDFIANRSAEEARRTGRFVMEDHERVDVLVARAVSTFEGQSVRFEDVWERRAEVIVAPGVVVTMPSVADLILTKKFGQRSKDAQDLRMLRMLTEEDGE